MHFNCQVIKFYLKLHFMSSSELTSSSSFLCFLFLNVDRLGQNKKQNNDELIDSIVMYIWCGANTHRTIGHRNERHYIPNDGLWILIINQIDLLLYFSIEILVFYFSTNNFLI